MGSRLKKLDMLSRSQFWGLRGTSIGQKRSFYPSPFLRKCSGKVKPIILGLKCYSHDTGAAIVSDESGSLVLHAILRPGSIAQTFVHLPHDVHCLLPERTGSGTS